MKILIIGGVAGGATAAARARRLDEKAEIVVLERGSYTSFANCGLPYHVGGAIMSRDSLLLVKPEDFKKRMNIEVKIRSEALSIDRARKLVSTKDLASGRVYDEPYDKLLIATGSTPVRPPIPGADSPEVLSLWTIDDMDKVLAKAKNVRSAIVVGAGFIGLELAEAFRARGLAVELVEALPQVMPALDPEMAQYAAAKLVSNGVSLHLGSPAESIEKTPPGSFKLNLKGAGSVEAGLIVVCAGVRPNSALAKAAGLELGPRGGIVVDAFMRSSDPDIYAVGDVVQTRDLVLGSETMLPLAGPANKQARVAASNMLGGSERYEGVVGTSICKIFDLCVASTGASERKLEAAKTDFFKIYLHPFSHVNYYPGAEQMHVKALFSKSGRLLGAQIAGGAGVDKRIDVLASAVRHGLTANDLAELELAYAPPYGAAKDPVNFAGFVALNVLDGTTRQLFPNSVPPGAFLVDVRTPDEFSVGSVPGAVNFPLEQLRERLAELPKDKPLVVFCRVGIRSYQAERLLRGNGFEVFSLAGGYMTWLQFNPPPLSNAGSSVPPASCAGASCQASALRGAMKEIDVRGLQCPGPIIAVKKALEELPGGQTISVLASDDSFARDLPAWCKSSGNALENLTREGSLLKAVVRKGSAGAIVQAAGVSPAPAKRATIVLFSGDLDKALAAFIIASGYASLGMEVSIFCTFWGLSALRKDAPPPLQKDLLSRLFGFMTPRGARKLALSKMHMLGLGTAMMKNVMAMKNVDSLPAMIENAGKLGVKLLACEMAMNVMGVKKEELLDGVEVVGVASFASLSAQGGPTLFI